MGRQGFVWFDVGGIVWEHGREGVGRGGCTPVVEAVPGRGLGTGTAPVDGDKGGCGVRRPCPNVYDVFIVGGGAEEGEGD